MSELTNSSGSAESESCGESWALGALSPLLCVLVPPCPSPRPLSFPHCCDFLCFPVPLLFSLFFCPAPSSSLAFSLLSYCSLFFFSLRFCPVLSPSFFVILCLCPAAHRCFLPFPSLCPELHLSLFFFFLWHVPWHSFPLCACTHP